MRATKLMRAARVAGLRAEVEPAPLGVVGIIGPWNFPLNLVVLPAAAAFAAGNRVMIKMSEITSHTAEVMCAKAPDYFDETELAVLVGGADTAAEFSTLPLDHLFFTGSPGGRRTGAARCIGEPGPGDPRTRGQEPGGGGVRRRYPPLCHPDRSGTHGQRRTGMRLSRLRLRARSQDRRIRRRRPPDVAHHVPVDRRNGDYCSSVNDANFDRVVGLIDDARTRGATVEAVAPPGESLPDRTSRKIAPTIVRDIDDTMRIAREEIFGPVLVVHGYATLTQAIDYINARPPAPLVAYWYGPDGTAFRTFVSHTRSGGVARNDFAAQMIPSAAPFGGVGRSGMGAYHARPASMRSVTSARWWVPTCRSA